MYNQIVNMMNDEVSGVKGLQLLKASEQYAVVADADLDAGFPGKNTGGSTGDITFGWFAKYLSLPSDDGSLFGGMTKGSAGSERSFKSNILGALGDKLDVRYDSSSSNTSRKTTNAIIVTGDLSNVVSIIISIDVSAKTIKMYKNGVIVAMNTAFLGATSIDLTIASFTLGARDTPTPDSFADIIVRSAFISNAVLNDTQISDIHTNGVDASIPNGVGAWDFNNLNGLDLIGSNNFSFVNNPLFVSL